MVNLNSSIISTGWMQDQIHSGWIQFCSMSLVYIWFRDFQHGSRNLKWIRPISVENLYDPFSPRQPAFVLRPPFATHSNKGYQKWFAVLSDAPCFVCSSAVNPELPCTPLKKSRRVHRSPINLWLIRKSSQDYDLGHWFTWRRISGS